MNISCNNLSDIDFKGFNYYTILGKNAAKKQILNSNTLEEAADTFEKYARDTRQEHFEDISKITTVVQISTMVIDTGLLVAGLLASIPALIFAGAGLCAGSLFLTNNVLLPMQKKYLDKNVVDNYYQSMIDRGIDDLDEIKKSPIKKDYKKHKAHTQNNLLNWLNGYYKKTSKADYYKFSDYIINNYDEYYWNKLIPYCLRYSDGIEDDSMKARFDNFLKLKEMSEAVYYMWHNSYIGAIGYDLNKENDELYNLFEKQFPNRYFCDYLYNNWRKDKNGVITDEEVDNFKKIARMGPHQAFPFLDLCHNKDGHLAWDVADDFEYASVEIEDALYYENLPKKDREKLHYDVLNSIIENSYDKNGVIDAFKFKNLHAQIKNELDTVGIKNSKTLKRILDSQTRSAIGMFDDDIESVEQAINKPNRLYDSLNSSEFITKFLQKNECSPSEVFGLLYKLTTTEDGKSKIIEEFSSNPRMGQDIKDLLIEKLGGDKKAENYFNTWYYDEKYGYRGVYTEYYLNLWENAKDLIELIKQSPNIAPWAYIEKAEKLGISKNIGQIPQDFSDENNFKSILKQLRHIDKKYEKLIKQKTENIDFKNKITINNVEYIVEKINSGHSIKSKYEIRQNKEGANTYILKFIPHNITANSDKNYLLKESMMLKSDSPYLNALVDFYLKENGCKNSADIEYFDFDEQAVLYKKTEGILPEMNSIKGYDNVYDFNKNGNLKDIKDLGITFNDISYKNLIKQTDGTLVLIDSGHVKFTNPFRPEVIYKNISLSNLCGREIS